MMASKTGAAALRATVWLFVLLYAALAGCTGAPTTDAGRYGRSHRVLSDR